MCEHAMFPFEEKAAPNWTVHGEDFDTGHLLLAQPSKGHFLCTSLFKRSVYFRGAIFVEWDSDDDRRRGRGIADKDCARRSNVHNPRHDSVV